MPGPRHAAASPMSIDVIRPHFSALVYIGCMYVQIVLFAASWMFYVENSVTQNPDVL